MTPMTKPAAKALSLLAEVTPIDRPKSRTMGATVSAAKYPYTTVGTPARISRIGFSQARTRGCAYCVR